MIDKLARLWRNERRYRIGSHSLALNADHALPAYQRKFSTYDRFLPELGRQLEEGATVIDIGANVGDTIAAMASANLELNFIAVEPSDQFLPLLRRNCATIMEVKGSRSIEILACYVTDKLMVSGVSAGRGTAHMVLSANQVEDSKHNNISLDSVIAGTKSRIGLIKSDTDGFDWSVLSSGMTMIAKLQPMLFFECEVGNAGEHVGSYTDIFGRLREAGYGHFFIFDNFGAFMFKTCDIGAMEGLLTYVAAQNDRALHRTIHYFDVLAVSDSDCPAAQVAVTNYVAQFSMA